MTAPDRGAVSHMAGLARLHFSDDELEQFQQEFTAILEMVRVLDELKATSALEPEAGEPIPMRPDAVTSASRPDAMLRNAPDREGGSFRVPVVIGGED